MRLDKYLKVSRLIKRRTVANDACDTQRVTIAFGNRQLRVRVLAVLEHAAKQDAQLMYEEIE